MKRILKIILPWIIVVIFGLVALNYFFSNKAYERKTKANEKEVAEINRKNKEYKKESDTKHEESQKEIEQLKANDKEKNTIIRKTKKEYRAANIKKIKGLNKNWKDKFGIFEKEHERVVNEKDQIINQIELQVIGLKKTIVILEHDNSQYKKDVKQRDKTILDLNRKFTDQSNLKPKKTKALTKILCFAGGALAVAIIK